MATFYVGQRVRLARPAYPKNLGQEGVIESFDSAKKGQKAMNGRLRGDCDCSVLWDKNNIANWQCLDQLEPIQPEGHKTVEWSECLWMPEHLREVA